MYNEISWAYVAGFFDGEGSLGTYSEKYKRVLITLTQGEKQCDVLFVIQDFLEEHEIISKVRTIVEKRKNRDNIRQLYICNQVNSLKFLRSVCPYLVVKHDKAIEIIEYLEERLAIRSVPGWRRNIVFSDSQITQMKKLYSEGYSQAKIAKVFGVNQVMISRTIGRDKGYEKIRNTITV